ncbi:MAG TPA: hypothetical protein PKE31_19715 [Pseudomonadota bacterium]|nr:hypothetical protein [Pseudomonadota bacterium]
MLQTTHQLPEPRQSPRKCAFADCEEIIPAKARLNQVYCSNNCRSLYHSRKNHRPARSYTVADFGPLEANLRALMQTMKLPGQVIGYSLAGRHPTLGTLGKFPEPDRATARFSVDGPSYQMSKEPFFVFTPSETVPVFEPPRVPVVGQYLVAFHCLNAQGKCEAFWVDGKKTVEVKVAFPSVRWYRKDASNQREWFDNKAKPIERKCDQKRKIAWSGCGHSFKRESSGPTENSAKSGRKPLLLVHSFLMGGWAKREKAQSLREAAQARREDLGRQPFDRAGRSDRREPGVDPKQPLNPVPRGPTRNLKPS